jgi:hypothetical protein
VLADRTKVGLPVALNPGEHRRVKGVPLTAIPALSRAHALTLLRSQTCRRSPHWFLHGALGSQWKRVAGDGLVPGIGLEPISLSARDSKTAS